MNITKTVERQSGRDYLVITAELRENDPSGISDGFAITASLYEARGNRSGKSRFEQGRDCDACGCLHDEIRETAPELTPLVDVHLAGLDGTPMHAVANGWYFYSGEARRYEESRGETWSNREGLSDRERGARALSIPVEQLPEGLDKAGFSAFAESLADYWLQQAHDARALLESLA